VPRFAAQGDTVEASKRSAGSSILPRERVRVTIGDIADWQERQLYKLEWSKVEYLLGIRGRAGERVMRYCCNGSRRG